MVLAVQVRGREHQLVTVTPDTEPQAVTNEVVSLLDGTCNDPDFHQRVSQDINQALIRVFQEEIRSLRQDREALAGNLLMAETLLLQGEKNRLEQACDHQAPSGLVSR